MWNCCYSFKCFLCRYAVVALVSVVPLLAMGGKAHNVVVVDSITRMPLSGASVFDRLGNVVGMCGSSGNLPYIPESGFPVTVRYLGFKERVIRSAGCDTVFLQSSPAELPEVVIESKGHKVMHMLAYVREYSTLTTYTDTVFLFREKMADYMIVPDKGTRFRGWTTPRTLKTKSYYRFTNAQGVDSVSDRCGFHFSWSDWIGVGGMAAIPKALRDVEYGADKVMGKYSATEAWTKHIDNVAVDVNILADTTSRKWVPNLALFFRSGLDFEHFRIRFNYDNVVGDSVSPMDMAGYSFNIESNGRGHEMFMFNRVDEPFFVSTYAEVYMVDKEYITVKEAKKWERLKIDTDVIGIYEPADAPDLQPSIMHLVERVNHVDHDRTRLSLAPDQSLVGREVKKQHFGDRVLQLFKTVTGISRYKMNRNMNRHWKEFKKDRIERNKGNAPDE